MSFGRVSKRVSAMARGDGAAMGVLWLPLVLVLVLVLLCCAAGGVATDGNVTLESLTIFTTHEWFGRRPTVYFRCRDEERVYLPDVVSKHKQYEFMGQESFQPLTTLRGQKCKRCGLYEQDTVKADDVFYEAELCPRDFMASPDGRFVLFREKELNASLLCPGCAEGASAEGGTGGGGAEDEEERGDGPWPTVVVAFLVLAVLVGLGVVVYSKWRQKQRREQQARFVKMFEEDDDLDAELGLKDDDL